MRRAVFLDRDGVLNEPIVKNGKPYPPAGLQDLVICEDAPEACSALRDAGFVLVVVTNQPDVARGVQNPDVVANINREIAKAIHLDEFRTCYHDDGDNCHCRKPKPGLLLAAAEDLLIDLGKSFMVGDRWRDIDAGTAAGCRTVLIDRGYTEGKTIRADFTAQSLKEAADWILNQ
jgi:D-glycero-D-manno-heptose 1,7-bisphosphate phosphatase